MSQERTMVLEREAAPLSRESSGSRDDRQGLSIDQMRAHLEMEAHMMHQAFAENSRRLKKKRDWPYTSLAEFVVRNGVESLWQPLPEDIHRSTPRECFANAARLVLEYPERFTYVEGYGWSRILPISHAWVVETETGRMLDTTWDFPTYYLGVPILTSYLTRVLLTSDRYGVFDKPEMEFPLLTGRHRLEEAMDTEVAQVMRERVARFASERAER